MGSPPREGTAFTSVFTDGFGSNPALVVFYIILGRLFFSFPLNSWETWEMGRMLHRIRTCLTQVGIIFTDEPLG